MDMSHLDSLANKPVTRILLLGGGDPDHLTENKGRSLSCDVFTLNGDRDHTYFIQECPGDSINANVVTVGNTLYMVGGGYNKMYRFDIDKFLWKKCPDMKMPVENQTLCATSKYIASLSGRTLDGKGTSTVQLYSIEKGSWRWGKPLPGLPKEYAASVALNGDIVLSGGNSFLDDEQLINDIVNGQWELGTKDVWRLAIGDEEETDSYIQMPVLNNGRWHHMMAVIKGALFVVGGENDSGIEVWTADIGRFFLLPQCLPMRKYLTSAMVENDRLYIMPSQTNCWSNEQDLKLFEAGDCVDNTMLVLYTEQIHVDNLLHFMIDENTLGVIFKMETIKLNLQRSYIHGSQAALISIPQRPPKTLLSLLTKLRNLPTQNADLEILRDATDYILSTPEDCWPTSQDIKKFLVCVYKAVFAGTDFSICSIIIDTMITVYSRRSNVCSYSMAVELLLDEHRREFLYDAPEKYLALLKHFSGKHVAVRPEAINSFVYKNSHTVPFLQLAVSKPWAFYQFSRYLATMVKQEEVSDCIKQILFLHSTISPEDFILSCRLQLAELKVSMDDFNTCAHFKELRPILLDWDGTASFPEVMKHHVDIAYYQSCKEFTMAAVDDAEVHTSECFIAQHIKTLFEKMSEMLPHVLQFAVHITGSVGEGTKVGRPDELDIQLELPNLSNIITNVKIGCNGNVDIKTEDNELLKNCQVTDSFSYALIKQKLSATVFGNMFNAKLQECLRSLDWNDNPLRVIGTSHPWHLIWIQPGNYCGMHIFIDVVPVITISQDVAHFTNGLQNEYRPDSVADRIGDMLGIPKYHNVKVMLKWGKPCGRHRWYCTVVDSELDIMNSLPNALFEAYKLVKLLLEIDHWQQGGHYAHAEKPVSSYMLKNALFWILHAEIMKEETTGWQVLKCINSEPSRSTRITYCEASVQWATRIIEYVSRMTEETNTLRSFFISDVFLYKNNYDLNAVRAICHKLTHLLKT